MPHHQPRSFSPFIDLSLPDQEQGGEYNTGNQSYCCTATPAILYTINYVEVTFSLVLPSCTASKPIFVSHWLFGSCLGRIERRHRTSLEVCPLRSNRYFSHQPKVLCCVTLEKLMAFSSSFALFSRTRWRRRRRSPSFPLAICSIFNQYGPVNLLLVVHNPGTPNLHRALC